MDMNSGTEGDLRQRFLGGMSRAATSVTLVTTDGPAGRFGLTVSAMSSVSIDGDKPILMVCVGLTSNSVQAILANGVFCVNLLRTDQTRISDCFAGRFTTEDGDKFSCAEWLNMPTQSPRLVDPLAAFDCRIRSTTTIGGHVVIFGEVGEVVSAGGGLPLVYANRSYAQPLPL